MSISKETYEQIKKLIEEYENKSTNINNEEPPYLEIASILIEFKYNTNYGDNRICECGHPYYRHFDTYEEMYACGCKYCNCFEFKEKK